MASKSVEQKPVDIREIMADYDKAVAFFANTPAEAWSAIHDRTALTVFAETCQAVPAYQEFLCLKGLKPQDIKSIDDFPKIPISDKYNYIQSYGFNEVNLVKAGENLYSYSLSSGTVDEPTIWPRYYQYEEFLPLVFDLFMRSYWQVDKKSTLFINAFAMGPWIAGFTVHSAIRPLTQKYNLTMGTTGADIEGIVYSIVKLAKYYDQVIIFSYPTFARTILDRLEDAKVNLKKINLKMFIAGEGHTVEWRQYVNKLCTGDAGDLTAVIDGYGITDAGLLGLGSALTNLVRDLAHKDVKLREALFGKTDSVPSLFQYNPGTYHVEEYNGEIVFTTKSTTPLVRYNIHDRGGVIRFREVERILNEHGYDYKKIITKKKLPQEIIWQQPFVYCFGRRDDTVIIGGANVFPEQIAPALFNDKVKDIHSFKLATDFDKEQHQQFYVLLELRAGVTYNKGEIKRAEKRFQKIVLDRIKSVNFDFADAHRVDPVGASPVVKVFKTGEGPFASDFVRTKPRLILKTKQ